MYTRGGWLRAALLVWLLATLPIVGHHETAVATVARWAAPRAAGLVPAPEQPDVLLVATGQLPPVPAPAPGAQWCADQPGRGYCTVLADGGGPALPTPPPPDRRRTVAVPRPAPGSAPPEFRAAPPSPPPRAYRLPA